VSPVLAATKVTLNDLFEVTLEHFNRVNVAFSPGFQVLHLTLAPEQSLPRHTHPGRHVLVQGLKGSVTVELDGEASELDAGQLLHFSGETSVSLCNDGDEACAVLITLAKKV